MRACWFWATTVLACVAASCVAAQGDPSPMGTVGRIRCTPPHAVYPSEAIADSAAGRTVVKMVVGVSGEVESVSVMASSGDSRLDGAAVAAVAKMRCTMVDRQNRPMPYRVTAQQSVAFEPNPPAVAQ